MTKPATECRFGIVRRDSDTDSAKSENSFLSFRRNLSNSASNPFGYIRYYDL